MKLNQLQNLLHDALIATNHVQSSAIIRRKDNVLRASSVGFNVSDVTPRDAHHLAVSVQLLYYSTVLKVVLVSDSYR